MTRVKLEIPDETLGRHGGADGRCPGHDASRDPSGTAGPDVAGLGSGSIRRERPTIHANDGVGVVSTPPCASPLDPGVEAGDPGEAGVVDGR